MSQDSRKLLQEEIGKFSLPAYNEIPNVGLFLEQVSKYIGEFTAPLECVSLTGSMISNYVKKKIIKNPVKKQYDREQIAYLFFIAIAKTVLSLEDIQLMLALQREAFDEEAAYEYFRTQLKEILVRVCDSDGASLPAEEAGENAQKVLLQKVVLAAAHKVYLDKSFRMLRENQEQISC